MESAIKEINAPARAGAAFDFWFMELLMREYKPALVHNLFLLLLYFEDSRDLYTLHCTYIITFVVL